jgi:hypothetical protein
VSVTWDDLVTFAVTLPEVTESTSYGTPALKVAGTLMGRLRTDAEGALALKCSTADKESLVAGPDLVDEAWHIAAPATLRRQRDA